MEVAGPLGTPLGHGISLEGMMLKLKLWYFGHLMRRVDSLEKTLMLGGIGGRRRRGRQRMRWLDGITRDCALGQAGKEGAHLARMGASQGFPRAAAPVGVFLKPEYSLEGLILKLNLQYSGHLLRNVIGKDPDAGKD